MENAKTTINKYKKQCISLAFIIRINLLTFCRTMLHAFLG